MPLGGGGGGGGGLGLAVVAGRGAVARGAVGAGRAAVVVGAASVVVVGSVDVVGASVDVVDDGGRSRLKASVGGALLWLATAAPAAAKSRVTHAASMRTVFLPRPV